MEIITFKAERVSVEGSAQTSNVTVTVTVEANARNVVEDLALVDRLYNLEPREIIDETGATKLLTAFTEEELVTWARADMTDPTEMLNAIGLDAIYEYLSHVD